MPELRPAAPPPHPALLRTLADQLGQIVPGWRLLATGVLAESAHIDLVGTSHSGQALVVSVGDGERDLELIARTLAHRAWLAPRLRDWLQLAPNLDLAPDAPVAALVLCPDPSPEARAIAASLGTAALRLARYRFFANGTTSGVLIELVGVRPQEGMTPVASTDVAGGSAATSPATPQAAPFRTGLSDAELGLSEDERREFE